MTCLAFGWKGLLKMKMGESKVTYHVLQWSSYFNLKTCAKTSQHVECNMGAINIKLAVTKKLKMHICLKVSFINVCRHLIMSVNIISNRILLAIFLFLHFVTNSRKNKVIFLCVSCPLFISEIKRKKIMIQNLIKGRYPESNWNNRGTELKVHFRCGNNRGVRVELLLKPLTCLITLLSECGNTSFSPIPLNRESLMSSFSSRIV